MFLSFGRHTVFCCVSYLICGVQPFSDSLKHGIALSLNHFWFILPESVFYYRLLTMFPGLLRFVFVNPR